MSTRGLRRLLVILVALVTACLGLLMAAPGAAAHPLGNFTVNSYSAVLVQPDSVVVQLVVDSAEIPTVQEFPDVDGDVDGEGVSDAAAAAYAAEDCERAAPGVLLTLDGARAPLTVTSADLAFLPGQAGLATMRLECQLETSTALDPTGAVLEYVDRNSLDRTGWREITLAGDGVTLTEATTRTDSVSGALRSYPADLLTSPLDQRSASANISTGSGVPGSGVPGSGVAGSGVASRALPEVSGVVESSGTDMGLITETFTDLVSARNLGPGFAAFALGLSILLGALHAFAPGHGKTLMAAYLLGRRGSLRQVGIIGLTVTLTHTAGVLVLGVVLSTVAFIAPERVYGWLGLASGLLLVAIGATLLRQALRRSHEQPPTRTAELAAVAAGAGSFAGQVHQHEQHHGHDHGHGHGQGHGHGHDHGHDHGHGHGHGHGHETGTGGVRHSHGWGGNHTHPAPATSLRGLIGVGFAGGMVPSPSALIVLLGGIALGRAWFGVLLVLGYGIGMALALIGTGLVLARSRDRIARWAERRRNEDQSSGVLLRGLRHLPAAAAAAVVLVGLGLIARSINGL